MIRQRGGRVLQAMIYEPKVCCSSSSSSSSSSRSSSRQQLLVGGKLRSSSSWSQQSHPTTVLRPSSSSSSSSYWKRSPMLLASPSPVWMECIHTHKNSSSSISLVLRRWKSSNLHKRATQALGKNMKKMQATVNDDDNRSNDENKKDSPPSSSKQAASLSDAPETDKDVGAAAAAASVKTEAAAPGDEEEEEALPPHPPSSVMQGHLHEFAPRIVVVGVGGAGGNAVNNMIANHLHGVDFLALNTDAQHLSTTLTDNRIQIGSALTSGLGCGANPDAGRLAAEESRDAITETLNDAHMVFITAGMGGGTGTGAAPVVAEICYNLGILTVGVVTKPFRFEGTQRMRLANEGTSRLREVVDTLIVIPNQNLFALANDQTSFVDSFAMADDVLLAGVKSITDLMTTPGLINLDFADVQSVMSGMGNAILGTGESSFDDLKNDKNNNNNKNTAERAVVAAEMALANPLLGSDMDIGTAKGMLVNITGGKDMTLFEVDRAAQLITERVEDDHANIIFGSAYDSNLEGSVRVSVVATGIEEYQQETKS